MTKPTYDDLLARVAQLEHEHEARDSEDVFAKAFRLSPHAATITRAADGKFIDVNEAFAATSGFSRAECLASSTVALKIWVDDGDRLRLAADLRTGRAVTNRQALFRTKSGEVITALFSAQMIDLPPHGPCVLSMVNDISDRQRAEAALRESESRWAFAIDSAGVGVLDWNIRTGEVRFSDRWLRMTGYARDELAPRIESLTSLVHPDDLPAAWADVQEVVAGRKGVHAVEHRLKHKQGHWLVVEARSLVAARDASGQPLRMIGTHLDITQRKRMEEALRRSEKILAESQRQSHVGSFEYDFASGRLHWSEEMLRIFGVSREDLAGSPDDFLRRVHPEDLPVVERVRTAGLVPDTAAQAAEIRIQRPDGSVRFIRMLFETSFGADGRPLRRLGTVLDLTEARQAEAERARLEANLQQAQKMEAVGQLAGGIAHDFNNLLAAMIMQLNMLRLKPSVPPDDLKGTVNEILESANRAAELTKQLLLVSRRQPMQRSRIDANALVRGLTALLERLLGEHIALDIECDREPLWFEGDAGMIEQVVTNLCVNARDSMPAGGRLTLATSTIVLDDELARGRDGARAGRFVCLRVSDTGCGMEPSVLERIFEAFFTTKAPGEGTGLGLAMVHAIVSKHRGWVEVESHVGQGSSFGVFLPLVASPSATAEKPAAAAAVGGRERILLVEDEVRVRNAAVFCLDHLGYRVTTAADGREALRIWEQEGGAFDLLLTDMVMPAGLSGLDLCARLRQTKADLRTVVMSGYSVDLSDGEKVAAREVTFLQKPYSLDMLAAAIRECLDGKS